MKVLTVFAHSGPRSDAHQRNTRAYGQDACREHRARSMECQIR
jgi:hypothetical protein